MASSLFRTKSIDRLMADGAATGEGALKRTIDHQVVNEYRGAISALNSGAPFMFTKADSALGSSVLGFARGVDKPAAAVPAAVTAR